MKINKYILEISVFICGAVVMVFELVGSRVLAPYFGTSIYVWTSLIGIILGSLSLGYFLGGKVSDKRPRLNHLALIIFLSGAIIGFTILFKDPLLTFMFTKIDNIKVGSVAASLIIFTPASILLGMVSPYAAKLKIKSLDSSGSIVGNLYAISTTGSIVGTFLSGFYLIPRFGTNKLLFILAATLLAVSAALTGKKFINQKVFVLAIFLLGWLIADRFSSFFMLKKEGVIDVDTGYNRIWIYDYQDQKTKNNIRVMSMNSIVHSLMALNKNELAEGEVEYYVKYYHLASYFNANFKKTLMLGGAGYSYPKDYLRKYPSATIDVVEIDPMTTELARKYFNLKENPRLRIFHEDGRVYLNRTSESYDAIFIDAFTSTNSVPYQLTTRESVKKEYDILNDNGIVIVNLISSIEGKNGRFLRAQYKTYKSLFPQVYLFSVNDIDDGSQVQNFILTALKSNEPQSFKSEDPDLNEYLGRLWKKEIIEDMPIITDDYAPVDSYISNII